MGQSTHAKQRQAAHRQPRSEQHARRDEAQHGPRRRKVPKLLAPPQRALRPRHRAKRPQAAVGHPQPRRDAQRVEARRDAVPELVRARRADEAEYRLHERGGKRCGVKALESRHVAREVGGVGRREEGERGGRELGHGDERRERELHAPVINISVQNKLNTLDPTRCPKQTGTGISPCSV